MNSKTAVIVIVALLVGILIAYGLWGNQARQLASEVAAAKAQAQEASVQEGALATKLQGLESQLQQASESLKTEQEARTKLEAVAGKKKK